MSVEDGLHEANNHETSISNLLDEWHLLVLQAKLVGERKVSISTSNDTVVVNNDQLLIRHLSLSILEDSVAINIPRICKTLVLINTI